MPRSWYDYHANKLKEGYTEEDLAKRQFNLSILADKKPYFMRYIYPDLMKQYNTYIKNTDAKCHMLFQMGVQELQSIPQDALTEAQSQFLTYFDSRMPVSMENSVMNRICRKVESALSVDLKAALSAGNFDINLLRSDAEYSSSQYYPVANVHKQYKAAYADIVSKHRHSSVDDEQYRQAQELLRQQFRQDCLALCSNSQQLCNILIDMCYTKSTSKKFVWDVCLDELIQNLIASSGGYITYPLADPDGEVVFRGRRYKMVTKEIGV